MRGLWTYVVRGDSFNTMSGVQVPAKK